MIKKILKKTQDGIKKNKNITCNICGKKDDKKHLCQLNFYRKTKNNPVVIDLLISEHYEEDKRRGKEATEAAKDVIESVLKDVEKQIKDGKPKYKKQRSKRRQSKRRQSKRRQSKRRRSKY